MPGLARIMSAIMGAVFARPLVWGCGLGILVALNPGWVLNELAQWSQNPKEAQSLQPQRLPRNEGGSEPPLPDLLLPDPQTVPYDEARAMRAARRHLPRFLATALDPPDHWHTVAVRVAFAQGSLRESLWVEAIAPVDSAMAPTAGTGGPLTGVLSFGARHLPGLEQGTRVTFAIPQIEDWGFVRDRRGYGYFTAHAQLPYLSPEARARQRAFLAEQPVPPGWGG